MPTLATTGSTTTGSTSSARFAASSTAATCSSRTATRSALPAKAPALATGPTLTTEATLATGPALPAEPALAIEATRSTEAACRSLPAKATVHHLHLLSDDPLSQGIEAACKFCFIQLLVPVGIELLEHLLSPSFGVKSRQAPAGKPPGLTGLARWPRPAGHSRLAASTSCSPGGFPGWLRFDILRVAVWLSSLLSVLCREMVTAQNERQHCRQDPESHLSTPLLILRGPAE